MADRLLLGDGTSLLLQGDGVSAILLGGDVNVTLTGAQVTASAGSLTASQQVSKALTGAQVTASAGVLTASQADPNKPVLISSTLWQQDLLGTSGTPGAKSITVPSDAQGVVVQVASTMVTTVPSLSITSNFAGTFTVINSGSSAQDGCSIGYAAVTSTGSKTLTLAWTEGLLEGPSVVISFIKNIDNSNWVRDALAVASNSDTTPITTSITSSTNDLVLVMEEQDGSGGTPATLSGFTSLGTTDGTYGSASRLQSANSPGASSTAINGGAIHYATITAIAIKKVAGGDVNVTLTGVQATVSAGTLTASQQVSKALTGAQATASAGTLTASQQVSKALTGAQATASAGTLVPTSGIVVALTGAQATAIAGTLNTFQQVSKALTGEQVTAIAGILTANQSTLLVRTIPLVGAQVVTLTGRIAPLASSQYPSPANVAAGVKYGPTSVEFTGTMAAAGYNRARVVNE